MRSIARAALASVLVTLTAAILAPDPVHAQGDALGVGPRFAFVRSDSGPGGESIRHTGGMLRARLARRAAFELALDYRSLINESLTERIRDYPLQASLLLYPVRAALSPYLLGGAGWYSQRVDVLSETQVVTTHTSRRFGYHGGIGGEVRLGRRAGLHLDYRYTFVRLGDREDAGAGRGAIPIPGTTGLQDRLKLSHDGSMVVTGLALFF